MSSFWPTTSRFSCLNTRTIFQSCHNADSLAARLAHVQKSIRPYSRSSTAFWKRNVDILEDKQLAGAWRRRYSAFNHPSRIKSFAPQEIVTEYKNLPQNYNDADGLAYRSQPLLKEEIADIFGKGIDAKTAQRMLEVIHGRRVAGTIDDPKYKGQLRTVHEKKAYKTALSWLREHVPVDEIQSAGLRAEEELAAMEQTFIADAETFGIYKPNSTGKYEPNSGKSKNLYGKSGLESIREAKEKEFERKEAEQELQRKRQFENADLKTGTLEKLNPRSQVELRRPGENPKLQYYLERAKVLPDKPPEMSAFQRLWPSGLVVIGTLIGAYIFTEVYKPPRNSARMFPDIPPSAATIAGIIVANSIVLTFWRFPPAFRLLNKYFIIVPGYPRAWSMIGNVFSHQSFSHFAMNMCVLWFVGTRLHEETGRANFLAIYMACGALGSFGSLTSWVLRNNFVTSSLGASGALSGIVACYLLLNANEKIRIFGFPPENWPSLSAMSFLCVLIGLDVLGLTRVGRIITVDHWAHLGGYAAGIGAAQLLRVKNKRREQMEVERRKNLSLVDRIREGKL
jgi:rhomboid-like protein